MERHCAHYECDKCGSILQALSARNVGAPQPTLVELIEEFKKRATEENKEFTVLLEYEGETTRSYLFGVRKHENCDGHYQKKYDVNLNELEINRDKP